MPVEIQTLPVPPKEMEFTGEGAVNYGIRVRVAK